MNIKIKQACFRYSVCGLNERFPSMKLQQTESNTEGDSETLLCEQASQDPYVAMTATVDPSLLPLQCSLLLACGHGLGMF